MELILREVMKRKIIITGSEGLLGEEISRYFEKQDLVQKLDVKLGHDLTNEGFVKKWFSKNHANYLINCFAINDHIEKNRKKNTLFNYSLESFRDSLNTNVISLFSVCREFARNNKKGAIINFSSIYGIDSPRPELYENSHKEVGYGVSKSAVLYLSKYLAVHLAPNIKVNCIIPGGVYKSQTTKFVKKYSKLTPMKRMMRKNELNGLLDYLCSEKSDYMIGAEIKIDGGYTSC